MRMPQIRPTIVYRASVAAFVAMSFSTSVAGVASDATGATQAPAPAAPAPPRPPTPPTPPTVGSAAQTTQAPTTPAQAPSAKAATAPPSAATQAATAAATPTRRRAAAPAAATHPLDPLTASEITTVAQILRARPDLPAQAFFPTIALNEPPKAEVKAFKPGTPFRREAFVTVFDRAANRTFDAIVDLRAKKVASFTPIPGAQPMIMFEEFDRVPPLVRADPAFQAAMRKRGITNIDDVQIDPWAPGLLDPKTEPSTTRWIRALAYLKEKKNNGYARPIEGVVALVNLTAMRVERVIDLGVYPVPPQTADLNARAIGPQRAAPKPLLHQQPLGASFTVTGHEVRWQKWRFRFSVHPREGLVLHTVGYEDGGRVRPILYRASIAEMLVPYAAPESNWTFRNAFDEGEYGLGRLTDSLEIGTDAPRHARFFDVVYADDLGKPTTIPRAVALYERDGGLLWKHFEYYSGTNDSRRARELVLFSIVTVGNYDYGLNWIFRQDGSLELQAVLTGIMLTRGVQAATVSTNGTDHGTEHEGRSWHLVAPNVAAVHHQHFFNMRLDFDVDEGPNSVKEINVTAVPAGPDNPDLNAFVMEDTPLRTEGEAQRDLNLATARRWLIVNPDARNALGQPAGYLLAPGDNSVPYLQPDSAIRQRAGFVDHHFWATRYDPAELYAAGMYPNQAGPGGGLPTWTKANRSLDRQDIVAWYTFGITHVPRPEEWPVMSATTAGFKLLPVSFFSKNPSLDVPK
jgi:primary-amine oxidase